MNKGIDHLAQERIWSESIYADCVTSDGKTGYMLRLCRYPDQAIAWVWAWVFTQEKVYGYNHHYLPCSKRRSIVEAPDLTYEQPGDSSAVFHRHGSRDNPQGASVAVEVMAHEGLSAPHEPGSKPLSVESRMTTVTSPCYIFYTAGQVIAHS